MTRDNAVNGKRRIRTQAGGAVLAVVLLLAGSPAALAAGPSWTPPSTVASTGGRSCDHSLAASTTTAGTRFHAAWLTASSGYTVDPPLVYYRASANGGASWTTPVRLSGLSKTWKGCPLVAASGSFVVVAWTQGGTRSIRLRVSQNAGVTWSPERSVTTTRTPGEPSLAVVGTRIYLAWTDAGASPHWSRYVTSTDRGVSWTGGRLDSAAAISASSWTVTTQIAVSGSTIFAAWIRSNGTDLMGRWSTNGGASWTAPTRIAVLEGPEALARGFSIAARPDRLAITWGDVDRALDDASPFVHVRIYSGGGWQAPVTLTAIPSASAAYGRFGKPIVMLLATSRVGLAWTGCSDNRVTPAPDELICGDYGGYDSKDILWSESLDGGSTWTAAVIVGSAAEFSEVVSAIWVSAQHRGVLIGHPNGITFRRGFDAT